MKAVVGMKLTTRTTTELLPKSRIKALQMGGTLKCVGGGGECRNTILPKSRKIKELAGRLMGFILPYLET